MKVVVVFTGIGVLPERRHNVSGHVQIPLETCKVLSERGHSVTVISTRQSDGSAMPAILSKEVKVKLVSDGRRRGQLGKQNARNGYRPVALLKQLLSTISEIRKAEADVVHIFGFERMVKLSAFIKMLVRIPTVVTVLGQKPNRKFKFLYSYPDKILSLTESVAKDWASVRTDLSVIRPGVVRKLSTSPESSKRFRVLYWREASKFGGADLCVDVYDHLAPRFPNIEFCFALRANKEEVAGLEELEIRHGNVKIYRFPYQPDLGLEELVNTSICVLFPNRELSIEPQMSVVETLAVGCPVVVSNVRSLPELVEPGKNGLVIDSEDPEKLSDAVIKIIEDPDFLEYSRDKIALLFNEKWNWQHYVRDIEAIYATTVPSYD